jgi:nucleolar GTP-binding protein
MREIEGENGGAGVFNFDMRMHWNLADQAWKDDFIPEIWNGKNIADFFDEDIEERFSIIVSSRLLDLVSTVG